MTITLYTAGTPNGRKVSIMLEETGIDYRVHRIDMAANEQKTPAYLAKNPNGKIPMIEDEETGQRVIESGAILFYLAQKTGKFWPEAEPTRSEMFSWTMFQVAHVGPMMGQLFHFRMLDEKVPYAETRFADEVTRVLGVLDTRLGQSSYLGGADYGIPDIMTFPWIDAAPRLGIDLAQTPNLQRWHADVGARPAVQRGMAVPT